MANKFTYLEVLIILICFMIWDSVVKHFKLNCVLMISQTCTDPFPEKIKIRFLKIKFSCTGRVFYHQFKQNKPMGGKTVNFLGITTREFELSIAHNPYVSHCVTTSIGFLFCPCGIQTSAWFHRICFYFLASMVLAVN